MKKIIIVIGPTASGKTHLAASLVSQNNGELISVDSRQVYQGFDLASGKEGELSPNHTGSALTSIYPSLRYIAIPDSKPVPQWLTDLAPVSTRLSVNDWVEAAESVVNDCLERQKTPILVGGSWLYLQAWLMGYNFDGTGASLTNPRHRASSGTASPRLEYELEIYWLKPEPAALSSRIQKRLTTRLNQGLIKESTNDLERFNLTLAEIAPLGLEFSWLANRSQQSETELATAIYRFARHQQKNFRALIRKVTVAGFKYRLSIRLQPDNLTS
ncbi:MAG: tRNA dimethylallyltransferase [Candidatus Berkelbacteria bacterium Gr01-1014_85]|uniref:tRNA dimethylallyltransferase n=1 Tax=Candidatus Berkelbacteria bacterium Gr01-1014_85 TaxID=2017150 RepID=A0A554JD00_9BACT|nr:MAG: tRNA dimethylallyltransferase [Candidatus Berkelbacteria bacterium Gr01-1014_85]